MIRYWPIAVTLGLLICPSVLRSQITSDGLRSLLRNEAGFTDQEFEEARRGSVIVKSLATKEKNEVAVCGIVRVRSAGELSMSRFAASLAQSDNETIVAKGKFGQPPSLDDLRGLQLGKADIENLKACKVGDCKLNLSAAMIERIRQNVDWAAPDASVTGPTPVFQQMLFDYVTDYLRRGNKALIQYENRQEPVSLVEENRILLDKALLIGTLAPEFIKYLRDLPENGLTSVERSLDWSTVNFGLDPIIVITDTAKYARGPVDSSQYVIATKQVYASRYSDASLVLSMLVTAASDDGNETYVIFSNRSRSESLRGLFGGFKRSVAGGEAVSRIKDILARAKDRLEAEPAASTQAERPVTLTTLDLILARIEVTRVLIFAGLVAAAALILLVYWRLRR